MDFSREAGARIRYFRKKRQMTLDQLAAAICKSKSCVSKYENGQVALDIPTLYDLASALGVRVTQLLYLPPNKSNAQSDKAVPAFFAEMSQFYLYLFDGRNNRIVRGVVDILGPVDHGEYHVQMYLNVSDYSHYQICENIYDGLLIHFDTLSLLILQNQNMEMDRYQIGVTCPYMNTPVKWGLAFGISSRPLMPTAAKVLLSKTIQIETPAFEKELRLSKEDIRLMKMYNMMTIL